MKTLANCTPKEFAVQTAKIANKIKKYSDGIKKLKETSESGSLDLLSTISYICEGNIADTMEICGAMCFMSGDEYAALNPENGDEDGIAMLTEIASSKRCIRFFTTALQLAKLMKTL